MAPSPPWVSSAEACWTHVYPGSWVLRASCVCLGSNGHYLLTDWPKWCRSNSRDPHRLHICTSLQWSWQDCSTTVVHRYHSTCRTWTDTCNATIILFIIPSPIAPAFQISSSYDKGGRNSPLMESSWASLELKLITGLRSAGERLSTFTRREPLVLVLEAGVSGMRWKGRRGGRSCVCRFSRVQWSVVQIWGMLSISFWLLFALICWCMNEPVLF